MRSHMGSRSFSFTALESFADRLSYLSYKEVRSMQRILKFKDHIFLQMSLRDSDRCFDLWQSLSRSNLFEF